MSEYWKSTPKYWCKHCSIFVKDTSLERKQHENTGKHQGNLKRFLRSVQNDHEREERDKARAKAEVDRLNKVVGGHSSTTAFTSNKSSSTPNSNRSKPPAASATDQKRQWAQLAEMGIQVPESARGEMAMAGEWKVSSTKPAQVDSPDDQINIGVRKRKFEGVGEEEEAGDTVVRRGWGSTTRQYPGSYQADDLDSLLNGASFKKEKLIKSEPEEATGGVETSKTKYDLKLEDEPDTSTDSTVNVSKLKAEQQISDSNEASSVLKSEVSPSIRLVLEDEGGLEAAPVFKKRRAKAYLAKEP